MFAPYQHAAAFIRAMRAKGSTAQFYNTSLVGSDALVKELGKQSHGVVVSQVMPHPSSGTSLIVREYKKELAAAGRAPSYSSMEATSRRAYSSRRCSEPGAIPVARR